VVVGTTGTAAEAGPSPPAFDAVTRSQYVVPFVRPVTEYGEVAFVATRVKWTPSVD
jgi:hypothetical protein